MIFPTGDLLDQCIATIQPLETSLGLKVNSRGTLSRLPAADNLQDWMNAVLFSAPKSSIKPFTQAARQFTINVTAWCCRSLTDGEDFVSEDMTYIETIANAILEMDVSTFNDETCQIEAPDSANIDYDTEESAFFLDDGISVVKVEVPFVVRKMK
ncbi:MAG: hypothetical protein AB2L14_25300 [Candidatus Xenobiia bacterium LiM19]